MKNYITKTIIILLVSSCFVSCSKNTNLSNSTNNKQNNSIQETTPTYTVMFQTNNGSKIAPIDTDILQNVPTPTRAGYLFDGWYFDTAFTNKALFPLEITNNMTLYAKWLKIEGEQQYKDIAIKMSLNQSGAKESYINLSELDLERLHELGYKIKINISYEVKYIKEYDVAFDIGYMGAPLYEVSIYRKDKVGDYFKDIKTTKTQTQETLTSTWEPRMLINQTPLTIGFSTDNIQNRILIRNIVISYECIK